MIYHHGFLDSGATFIANEEDSLGLKLVDEGFDLWMVHARGNRYSRDHMQADNLLFYND